MTDYLSGWNVGVDPEQTDVLPDGSILQEVTLVLVDTEGHYKNDEPQLRAPSPSRSPSRGAQGRSQADGRGRRGRTRTALKQPLRAPLRPAAVAHEIRWHAPQGPISPLAPDAPPTDAI